MEQPTIDVDQRTYELVCDYAENVKKYYLSVCEENQLEIEKLENQLDGVRRLNEAYCNRMRAVDLFLAGLKIIDS